MLLKRGEGGLSENKRLHYRRGMQIASAQTIASVRSEVILAAPKRHIIPADLAEHIPVWSLDTRVS